MPTVAEMTVTALAEQCVRTVGGVVGDALNPVTDAIRREDRIEWMGVRHEEVAAFAAGAQARLTGTIGVCMGTVGPGSIHLLNGLYDAKKSHAPVLAICGQVPSAELGSDYFQEVNNDVPFQDVAVFTRTITSPAQATTLLEQAVQASAWLTPNKNRPVLLDVVTNPDEVSVPGKVKVAQGWGFAIAKIKETLRSEGES
jgi:pyruvate dehydrogenase (quinone)